MSSRDPWVRPPARGLNPEPAPGLTNFAFGPEWHEQPEHAAAGMVRRSPDGIVAVCTGLRWHTRWKLIGDLAPEPWATTRDVIGWPVVGNVYDLH